MYTYFPSYGKVVRDSDGVIVAPVHDDQSQGYLDWLAWCAAGNEPAIDNSVPPVVPEKVSRGQMMAAMALTPYADGVTLLDHVEALVPTFPRLVQIAWTESNDFYRDNLFIAQLAPVAGLSSEQVDALFILAGTR